MIAASSKKSRPRLRLIRGGRGQKPKIVSDEALLRDLQHLSHDEAVQFMLRQVNEHIHSSGIYRVKRLFIPGDVSISFVPRHRYQLTVRDDLGKTIHSSSGMEISHAVLDLLSIWEEEAGQDAGPGIRRT